jgi:hypothetical protein
LDWANISDVAIALYRNLKAKMDKNLYVEKLAWFKQNEKPEAVLLVADNQERIRVIVAWGNLDVRCVERITELSGGSEKEVWEWLWENAEYSKKELIEKIGIRLSEAALEGKMKHLIGNRILYPDGTVNSFVHHYLREQVLRLFESKSKRSAKKGR